MAKTKIKKKTPTKKSPIPTGVARIEADKFDMRSLYAHPSPDDIAKNPSGFEHWRCASPEPMYAIYAERILLTDVPGVTITKPGFNVQFLDHTLYLDREDPDFEAMTTKLRHSDDFKGGNRLFCLSDMEAREAERMSVMEGQHVGLNEKAPLLSLGINNAAQEGRIRKALEMEDDAARVKAEKETEVLKKKLEAFEKASK